MKSKISLNTEHWQLIDSNLKEQFHERGMSILFFEFFDNPRDGGPFIRSMFPTGCANLPEPIIHVTRAFRTFTFWHFSENYTGVLDVIIGIAHRYDLK